MAEETAVENGRISNFEGLVTLPWIGSYCIPLCITHRPLPTRQIEETFCGQTDVRTYGRTFEIGFIRSTMSKSRPNNSSLNEAAESNIVHITTADSVSVSENAADSHRVQCLG